MCSWHPSATAAPGGHHTSDRETEMTAIVTEIRADPDVDFVLCPLCGATFNPVTFGVLCPECEVDEMEKWADFCAEQQQARHPC